MYKDIQPKNGHIKIETVDRRSVMPLASSQTVEQTVDRLPGSGKVNKDNKTATEITVRVSLYTAQHGTARHLHVRHVTRTGLCTLLHGHARQCTLMHVNALYCTGLHFNARECACEDTLVQVMNEYVY
jgi:hypothetical protein